MADDPRPPPAAIRITRPYESEDAFLENELDMITRTSVTLIGAQARPQGSILRFELLLSAGQVLFRGEGRVVGFKANLHQGLGGLTLRFTRLDSRGKTLVDRAAALRERRHAHPNEGTPPPSVVQDVPSSELVDATPPPLKLKRSRPPPLPPAARTAAARGSTPAPPPVVAPVVAPLVVPAPPPVARIAAPPASRDALLTRLRDRAKALDAEAVERILAQRRRA